MTTVYCAAASLGKACGVLGHTFHLRSDCPVLTKDPRTTVVECDLVMVDAPPYDRDGFVCRFCVGVYPYATGPAVRVAVKATA